MSGQYSHNQSGYVILVSFGLGLIVAAYLGMIYGFDLLFFGIVTTLAVCLMLFSSLTVLINSERLQVRFGLGTIRKNFMLADIESCQKVRNPWWYGWGIHLTPYGWLYNVSGLDAVEIKMKNGRKFRIGTDEPEELKTALNATIGSGK